MHNQQELICRNQNQRCVAVPLTGCPWPSALSGQVKNVALDNLYSFASEPKKQNAYPIKNYDGLAGILKNFEQKIFNIEGTYFISSKYQHHLNSPILNYF